jgi:hypothetical protein
MAEKKSISRALDARVLNPDITLAALVEAGEKLSALDGALSVPTLVGDWYVYHQIGEDLKETISSEHIKVLQEFNVINLDTTLGSLVEASGFDTGAELASATLIGSWYAYKSGLSVDDIETVIESGPTL